MGTTGAKTYIINIRTTRAKPEIPLTDGHGGSLRDVTGDHLATACSRLCYILGGPSSGG